MKTFRWSPDKKEALQAERGVSFDADETAVLDAYEAGELRSVATSAELARFKTTARATALKDRRVNIRLSRRTSTASKPRLSSRASRIRRLS